MPAMHDQFRLGNHVPVVHHDVRLDRLAEVAIGSPGDDHIFHRGMSE